MTTEEKAKAYDEALKWMRELYPGLHGATKEDAEHYFPELRESEDERIISSIIAVLENDKKHYLKEIAWLEKQKEQKPNIELIQRSWYMEGYHDGKFGKGPMWIIKTGEGGPKHELNPKYGQPLADDPKPAEGKEYSGPECGTTAGVWSEEDKRILKGIIGKIDHDQTYGVSKVEMLSFLKTIRPSWKPSEEHLSALLAIFNDPDNIGSQTCQLALSDLYEQLKKL